MKTQFSTTALIAVIFVLISNHLRHLLADELDPEIDDRCDKASPCQAGCYQQADNSKNDGEGDCVIVPVGHFSPEGDDTLRKCPEGTFMAQVGAEKCNDCPIGTAEPNKGSPFCKPCDEGLYASNPGSITCKMCNPGIYFGPGSVGIIRENAIEYCMEPTPVNPSPHNCDGFSTTPCSGGCYVAGNASIAANATRVCTIVPHGFYSPQGDDFLYMCPAGFYALEGFSECAPCAAGSASGVAGSGWCQLCPPSTFSSNKGAVSCSPCNSTMYFGPGSDAVLTVDESQHELLYCQKPLKDSMQNPASAPIRHATPFPSAEPSPFNTYHSTVPVVDPHAMEPSTTSVPTPIFDLVTKKSRPPQSGGGQPSFSFNQRDGDTSFSSKDPLFWIVYPILAGAILATAVAMCLYRRYRWFLWSHRDIQVVPPLPQEEWLRQTAKSSPPPIPNMISTKQKMEDDDESASGLFLDDDLLFH